MAIAGIAALALSCTAPGGGSYNGWFPVGSGPQDFDEEVWGCTAKGGAVTVAIIGYTDPDFVGSGLSVRVSKDLAPLGRRTAGSQVLVEQHLAGAGSFVTTPSLEAGECFLVGFEIPGGCAELNPPATFPPCKRFSTPGVTYRVQW
jgi:hypothetical protein